MEWAKRQFNGSSLTKNVRLHLESFQRPHQEQGSLIQFHDFVLQKDADTNEPNLVPTRASSRSQTDANTCSFISAAHNIQNGETYVIRDIQLLFVDNRLGSLVDMDICDLFEPLSLRDNNNNSSRTDAHPDRTGIIRFTVPNMCGPVPRDRRLIYQPNMSNLGIDMFKYVGLEDVILKPLCSPHETNFEVFEYGHPLAAFILENQVQLDAKNGDCIDSATKDSNKAVHMIEKGVVARARKLFRSVIFPCFQYTDMNHGVLQWHMNDKLRTKHAESDCLESVCDAPRLVMQTKISFIKVSHQARFEPTANELDF